MPAYPDPMFDLVVDVCNYIAHTHGTCCSMVDLYGDSVAAQYVTQPHNGFPARMDRALTYGQVNNVSYQQTKDTGYNILAQDFSLCSNVQNNETVFPCSISKEYMTGTSTAIAHTTSTSVGVTVGVEVGFGKC